MPEHDDSLESIFNRLESIESAVHQTMQVSTFIASFGNTKTFSYGAVVTAIKSMKDEDLTWERATARLSQEYGTRQLNVKQKGYEDGLGRERALKSKAHIQWYRCGKSGHGRRMPNWKNPEDHQKALMMRIGGDEEPSVVIDSGVSSHILKDRDMFGHLGLCDIRLIIMADGRTVSCGKSGTAFIRTSVGIDRFRT